MQHKVLTTEVQQTQNSNIIREESEKDLQLEEEEELMLKKKLSDSGLLTKKESAVASAASASGNSNASPAASSHTLPANGCRLRHRNSSPILKRRPQVNPNATNSARRSSKTLPRGFSLAQAQGDSLDCDVFGLYGELLNVRDYDCDSGERIAMNADELRKSDPELSTIPYRVSTLDRRVRMKTSRPRSLDMSSWSVESRSSSSQTTSSSEAGSERPSPNVSRNASFQSNGGSTTTICSPAPPMSLPPNSGPSSISSTATNGAFLTTTTTTQVVRWKDHPNKMEAPKTVITLMGGRGYINWRRASVEKQRTSALAQINNCDAFLVIWEMKL